MNAPTQTLLCDRRRRPLWLLRHSRRRTNLRGSRPYDMVEPDLRETRRPRALRRQIDWVMNATSPAGRRRAGRLVADGVSGVGCRTPSCPVGRPDHLASGSNGPSGLSSLRSTSTRPAEWADKGFAHPGTTRGSLRGRGPQLSGRGPATPVDSRQLMPIPDGARKLPNSEMPPSSRRSVCHLRGRRGLPRRMQALRARDVTGTVARSRS